MDKVKTFMTIREACNYTGLSQRFLREGCKMGKIPHVMSGNTYMINVALLMDTLNKMSRDTMKSSNVKMNPEVDPDGEK